VGTLDDVGIVANDGNGVADAVDSLGVSEFSAVGSAEFALAIAAEVWALLLSPRLVDVEDVLVEKDADL